jgi:hypothetical protein
MNPRNMDLSLIALVCPTDTVEIQFSKMKENTVTHQSTKSRQKCLNLVDLQNSLPSLISPDPQRGHLPRH